ncbi:MAG: ester cyclase [Candidatus Kariarchaeaceae archaeon]|jgi:predicted ester cyclase
MSEDLELASQNKHVMLRFWKEMNLGNLDIIEELCHPGISSRSYGLSRKKTDNRAQYRAEWEEMYSAFPDYNLEIFKIICQKNDVFIHGMQRGTQINYFHGIPATNNLFEIAAMYIFTFQNGKIIQETTLSDTLQLYVRLGQVILTSEDQERINQYLKHLGEIGLIKH